MSWGTPVTAEGRSPAQSPAVSTDGGSAGVIVPVITTMPDPTAVSGVILTTQPVVETWLHGVQTTSYATNVTATVVPADVVISGITVIPVSSGSAAYGDLTLGDGGDTGVVSIRFTLDNGQFVDSDPITVGF